MNKDQALEIFINAIKAEFPEEGIKLDRLMSDLGIAPEDRMHTEFFEGFSQITTDAIKTGDSDTALRHLNFMSRKLSMASAVEREYIDVYYTEPLMWDIKDKETRSKGWKLFPENIKLLFEAMWGKQSL